MVLRISAPVALSLHHSLALSLSFLGLKASGFRALGCAPLPASARGSCAELPAETGPRRERSKTGSGFWVSGVEGFRV